MLTVCPPIALLSLRSLPRRHGGVSPKALIDLAGARGAGAHEHERTAGMTRAICRPTVASRSCPAKGTAVPHRATTTLSTHLHSRLVLSGLWRLFWSFNVFVSGYESAGRYVRRVLSAGSWRGRTELTCEGFSAVRAMRSRSRPFEKAEWSSGVGECLASAVRAAHE